MIPRGCQISTGWGTHQVLCGKFMLETPQTLKSLISPNIFVKKTTEVFEKITIYETSYYSLNYLASIWSGTHSAV
jgi:hypothetical protein